MTEPHDRVVAHPHDRVVVHPFHGPGLAEALGSVPGIDIIEPSDADGVVAEIEAGAEILVTYRWDAAFLRRPLRWIQGISAGVDQFPLPALADADVVLTSARGAHTPAVAEHAIALLLATIRNLGPAMRNTGSREWDPRRPSWEVRGLTLGVLGLGSIGEEVARLATALGMKVIGTKRTTDGYKGNATEVFGADDTFEVCKRADAIVVTLPHAPTPVVGRREIDALSDGWIVNVGRGSAIDERALADAIKAGTLRGAGLDVFEIEPLPEESPLWDEPTVIITPHTAWATDRLAPRLAEVFASNLKAHRGSSDWSTRIV